MIWYKIGLLNATRQLCKRLDHHHGHLGSISASTSQIELNLLIKMPQKGDFTDKEKHEMKVAQYRPGIEPTSSQPREVFFAAAQQSHQPLFNQ